MTEWTPEQTLAITKKGCNLLLSAAAGSGKTAVLVERIIRLMTDPDHPVSISRLLVMTFTRSAASEMRSRIGTALSKELEKNPSPFLEKQLALLSSAQICTMHAFCQSVIRQYFYRIDLDPKFRIAEENELYLMQQDVLTDVLGRWYERNDPEFMTCVDLFSSRHEDVPLRDAILKLCTFALSMPFPYDWLAHLPAAYDIPENAPIDSLPWIGSLLKEFKNRALSWTDRYRRMFRLIAEEPGTIPYTDTLSEEYSFMTLLSGCSSWTDWQKAAVSFQFGKLPRADKKSASSPGHLDNSKTQIQTLRKEVKTQFQQLLSDFFRTDPSRWLSDMRRTRTVMAILSSVSADFLKSWTQAKKEAAVMDFSDMEHMALSVLMDTASSPEHIIPSSAALELRQRYEEVLIDEYQDTNGVQELIASLVSKENNCFMVGDIKQSIYRFRLADPTIFLRKYESYRDPSAAGGYRIDLSRNFRSDASILNAVNFIFRRIMQKEEAELSYGEEEALRAGRILKDKDSRWIGGPVDIDLIDTERPEDTPDDSDDADGIELEGRFIARKIHHIQEEKRTVQRKDGTFSPAGYGDIVILLRSLSGKASRLMNIFREEGIPAVYGRQDDFLSTPEVRYLWALLKILDNPRQDLAMTAVLRSPMVGLSEKDLALLRLISPESLWDALRSSLDSLSEESVSRCRSFISDYARWRVLSRKDSISSLLRTILDDTGLIAYVGGEHEGTFRQANLRTFYEKARKYDEGPMSGLYRFLTFLQDLHDEGKGLSVTAPEGGGGDAVRILSIHKSKGLEFPIVFLADTGKPFNQQDTASPLILHKGKGAGLYCLDPDTHSLWPTLYWHAVCLSLEKENRAEEERLLYVAMTRARDKLIITGHVRSALRSLQTWAGNVYGLEGPALPSHLITGASSYLDWIMAAAARSRSLSALWEKAEMLPAFLPSEGENFSFSVISCRDLGAPRPHKTISAISSLPDPALRDIPEWMNRRLSWIYSRPGAVGTPAKLTATSSVHLEEEISAPEKALSSSAILTPDLPEQDLPSALPSEFTVPPVFLSSRKISGTGYGTLMHTVMENLDFSHIHDETSVKKDLENMTAQGILTEDETHFLLTPGPHHPCRAIAIFLNSPLGRRLAEADHVRKELPFSLLLPADRFYPDCEPGETVFLQGVIDCLMEKDGQLTIIDYKTDRENNPSLLESHYRRQLSVYADAAESILQKPVVSLLLWSFHLGQAVPVSRI